MVNASPRGATDRVAYPCIHGAGTTHIDGFGHRFFDGKMWNGYPMADTVTMDGGARKNSILTMKDGIVTRGVLYDIPRLKGVPYLEPGERIFIEDLEAWEAETGVRVGPGDAFVLRWGRWARQDAIGPFDTGAEAAGLDNSVIPWLKARDVALIGWETPGYMLGVHADDRTAADPEWYRLAGQPDRHLLAHLEHSAIDELEKALNA